MSRFHLLALFALFLTCCASAPPPAPCPAPPPVEPPPTPEPCPVAEPQPDLDLFVLGISQLPDHEGEATLTRLRTEHPDSPFAIAAGLLLDRGAQLADAKTNHARLLQDKDASAAEREQLAQRVKTLEEALEKLKHLAIESEMRSK